MTAIHVRIVRIAPEDQQIVIEWQVGDEDPLHSSPTANEEDYVYTLEVKRRDEQWPWARSIALRPANPRTGNPTFTICSLINGVDYEMRIRVVDSRSKQCIGESPIRIARPGVIPGTVVNYIHPEDFTFHESGRSTASPSIAKLSNGRYVASHDVFWSNHGQNLTLLFASDDNGESWSYISSLRPCFWGKLFVHRDELYMLSTATEYGALLIRKSPDGGISWTNPTELIPAGSRDTGGPHKAPVPIVQYKGRIWTGVEYGSGSIGGHDAGVISAPVDADLLNKDSWAVTPFLKYDPTWPGTVIGGAPTFLEGNVVVTPDKGLVNFLRYQTRTGSPDYGKAVVLKVTGPRSALQFHRVVDFHGNLSKFTIHFDDVTQLYFAFVNRVTTSRTNQRNILTLIASSNLIQWHIVIDILNYQDNGWPEDMDHVGFQYVDWLFDGDDIIALSRTAINGARNFHDANHITFHRIRNFRTLVKRTLGH